MSGTQKSQKVDSCQNADMPLMSHLLELRTRLLRAVVAVLVVFCGMFPFAQEIYTLFASPLMSILPEGSSMVATDVASPFFAPFKLCIVLSAFVAIPVILYQVWGFIAPGLYKHEKRLVVPLLFSSTLLFYLGIAFAYFVVFPLAFAFFTSVAPEGVTIMTDINKYLDFVLKLFFAFGVAFEIPIATVIFIWTGLASAESLRKKRPYIIVIAFVVGMLLTPPDVISQTLLAVPMWLLYEVGIFFSGWVKPQSEAQEASS